MSKWTKEIPTEPGYYWFYGWFEKNSSYYKKDGSMYFVEVSKTSKSLVFVTNGTFLYPTMALGQWSKADVPDVPDLGPHFYEGCEALLIEDQERHIVAKIDAPTTRVKTHPIGVDPIHAVWRAMDDLEFI